MIVIEQFVRGKKVDQNLCEDGYVVNENFAAVIDGCTAKGETLYGGVAPGKMAAKLLSEEIGRLHPEASMEQAVDQLSGAIRRYYENEGIVEELRDKPALRAMAVAGIYSKWQREVWLIGDCMCRIEGQTYKNETPVDSILANMRGLVLELAMREGASVDELLERDTGREFIKPFLVKQGLLQNSGGSLSFAVLDGFQVDHGRLVKVRVKDRVESVILATDGYPGLGDSLEETEALLKDLLSKDPLCMSRNPSAKGIQSGDESFDDRCFLEIGVGYNS